MRQQSWEKVATPAKSLMKRYLQTALILQPAEGGLGHHWGQTVTITPSCSLAMPHLQEAKCISIEGGWGNGLFFLNGKQTGDLIVFPWPGCQQTKHSDPASLHVGTEVVVFGEEMTLPPHRMNKDKLSPSQAAPDKPQTDPVDAHTRFPTHLFVMAHTWEVI